jgi:hypothetical protein
MTENRTVFRWCAALLFALGAWTVWWIAGQGSALAQKPVVTPAPRVVRDPLAVDSNPHDAVDTRLPTPPVLGSPATPPPNDYFTRSISIGSLPYTNTEDTTEATHDSADPLQTCTTGGANPNSHSVWYDYNNAAGGNLLTAYTYGSSYDTVLAVYTGGWGALNQVACNDDVSTNGGIYVSQVFFTPTVSTLYHIEITSYSTTAGGTLDFGLRDGTPPTNDDINNALAMSSLPYTHNEDTFTATRASDDPTIPCHTPNSGTDNVSTVWFRYTPTASGTFIVDTIGSNYDTILSAWIGQRGNLINMACNDDQYGQQSEIQLPITAGITYYVEVASPDSMPGGLLTLNARAVVPMWEVREDMTLARDRLGVTSDGVFLYAIGGERYFTDAPRAFGPTNIVARYDPATNSWSNVAPMPVALEDHQAIYVGGRIYIPSGYAGSGPPFYGAHLVYNVAANSWTTAAAAPWPNGRPPLFYSLAATSQGYYVTGGYDGSSILANTWYYRVGNNTWAARAAMPVRRFGHSSTWINGSLMVVAGDNDTTPPGLFDTERYNPVNNTWQPAASQHQDRLYAANAVIPGSNSPGTWYLTGGGFSSYGNILASTEVYDPAIGLWALLPEGYNLITPRYLLGGAVLSGAFYTIGGFNNTSPGTLDANERLRLAQPTAAGVTALAGRSAPDDAPAAALLLLAGLLILAARAARARRPSAR